MTKMKEVYKCEVCGNIVEVLHTGVGVLICCGKPMVKQDEKTQDQGMEKHVPVISKEEDKVVVKIGDVPHPMEEKHFIEWIELTIDGVSRKKFLSAGDEPRAEFCACGTKLSARTYCNVHGLWKSA